MSSLRLFPPSLCLKPQSHRRDMPISAQHALVLRQCSCVISRLPRFQCPPGVQCAFASFHGQPRPFLSSCEATVFEGIGWTRPILPSRHRFSLYHRQAGLVSIEESSTPDAVPGERSWELTQTVELVALMALWYILNICFNIYNKQILKVYPFPMTISAFQFAIGSFLIFIMWICNLYKRPQISISQLAMILPLAIFHTLGNLFTNMSLGMVSVSFTHTIKAMEPFFTVIFSALFLGEIPTIWIISSLMPIVGGVALASFTEATFNWTGFWSAMASNATNQSRNVLSKKLMSEKEATLDNITLFSIITIMSFFLTLPVALYIEGIKFTPFYMQSTGLKDIFVRCFLVGFCFHAYQQVSYIILARVSPVTHSVSNCVKRVVVIVSSVLFFKTPVSALNSFGTAVALGGVFLYSKLKNAKPKGD